MNCSGLWKRWLRKWSLLFRSPHFNPFKMNWKTRHPQLYRILAKVRFSLAREKTIKLPFGAKMKVNPHSYVERCISEGHFENWRIEFFRSSIVRDCDFFDIGANVGLFSLLAAAQGANVHAFEPEPMNLSRLRRNLRLNPHFADKVKVWPIALGNHVGEVDFRRPLSDNYGRSSLNLKKECDHINVKMQRFEDMNLSSSAERFFKIDVEGSEIEVLAGMGSELDAIVPTVFLVEVHREGGVNLNTIIEIFSLRGFRVAFLDDSNGKERDSIPNNGDVALIARK